MDEIDVEVGGIEQFTFKADSWMSSHKLIASQTWEIFERYCIRAKICQFLVTHRVYDNYFYPWRTIR